MVKLSVTYTTTSGDKKTRVITYANPESTDATLKDFTQALYSLSTNTIKDIYKIDTAVLFDDDSDDIVTPIIEDTGTMVQLLNPNFRAINGLQYVFNTNKYEDFGGDAEESLKFDVGGNRAPSSCIVQLDWDGKGTVKLPLAYHFPLKDFLEDYEVWAEYRNIGSTQLEGDPDDGFTDILPLTLTSDGEYSSATLLAELHVVCRDDDESNDLDDEGKEKFWSAYRVITNPAELETVLDSDISQVIATVQNNLHTNSLPQNVQNEMGYSGSLLGVFTAEYVHEKDSNEIKITLNCTPRDESSEEKPAAVVYHNGTWYTKNLPIWWTDKNEWDDDDIEDSFNTLLMNATDLDLNIGDFFTVFVFDN